ncbi:MAG: sec-independent protein translocase protein TatC, partial [Solirubrobacteraceae bacterium]|nr:sec-independent protein translocase protein TatC [Solirubrobacteraceae bacterium]
MARILRPVGHDDRLSVVDHLDELRSRLIICGATLLAAFVVCFIFNHALLNLLNRPLPSTTSQQANHLSGLTTDSVKEHRAFVQAEALMHQLSRSSHLAAPDRALIAAIAGKFGDAARALPQKVPKTVPITIGVGEPFTTTLTVCFYFA